MSNIIRHKRSNTPGATPGFATFIEGEILLNTRDGKAFFKKVMPGSEELVELRGMRDTVRPAGQTGDLAVSETGIRQAISAVGGSGGLGSVGIAMPNIFVVSNSPLTSDGVINVGFNNQTKNKVLASPVNQTGQPSFRVLDRADIPTLPYDDYASFQAGLVNDLKNIVGVNGNYSIGTRYKGISFNAGQGISIGTSSPLDQTLRLTISATGAAGGGIDNSSQNSFLVADQAVSANIWTDIVEIEIREDGEYLINFQLTALKSTTGTSVIAARIIEGSQELGSAEQTVLTTLAPRASLAGHGYISFKGIIGGRYPTIKLQMWASATGWSAVRTTPSSNSERATQLTTVKLT